MLVSGYARALVLEAVPRLGALHAPSCGPQLALYTLLYRWHIAQCHDIVCERLLTVHPPVLSAGTHLCRTAGDPN